MARHRRPAPGEQPGVVPLAAADVQPGEARDVRQHREEGRRVEVVAVDVVAGPRQLVQASALPFQRRPASSWSIRHLSPRERAGRDAGIPAPSSQIGLVLRTGPGYLPGNCPGEQEAAMAIDVARVPLEEVLPLRELYRREMDCQIVHDSLPGRGFGDDCSCSASTAASRATGFVMGYQGEPQGHGPGVLRPARLSRLGATDVPPARRGERGQAGRGPVQRRPAHAHALRLRHGHHERHGRLPRRPDDEPLRPRCRLPRGRRGGQGADLRAPGWSRSASGCSSTDGAIVATGGIATHYNPPYGDLFMEVDEPHRRRGYGSYLIQELKRACYEMGRVPAARCNVDERGVAGDAAEGGPVALRPDAERRRWTRS